MDKRANIVAQLAQLLTQDGKSDAVFTAKVVSVDGLTCSIDYHGLTLTDVRLLPTTTASADKVLLIPKTGSYVLVASDGGDLSNLWIIRAQTADKIEMTCNGVNLMSVISDLIGALSGTLMLTTSVGAATGNFDPATIAKFKQAETAFKQLFK